MSSFFFVYPIKIINKAILIRLSIRYWKWILKITLNTLQTHLCIWKQGFPCVVFLTGKNLFSSPGNPVMKTGFFLCGNTTQGKACSGPVLALYGIAVWNCHHKIFITKPLLCILFEWNYLLSRSIMSEKRRLFRKELWKKSQKITVCNGGKILQQTINCIFRGAASR